MRCVKTDWGDSTEKGFFIFGDVSVKRVGEHRLLFSLFEYRK